LYFSQVNKTGSRARRRNKQLESIFARSFAMVPAGANGRESRAGADWSSA
jgi:hypothetical protein